MSVSFYLSKYISRDGRAVKALMGKTKVEEPSEKIQLCWSTRNKI